MEEEDDERLTELRNEVLEAQTNFRNMMMKILRGETSPVPNLFHTDDSPELRKTRLRPSMVERAIRPPPPLVSSTPMQFGRRKSFVPTTVEAVSPIIGLRRSTANTKIKTPLNENGDGGGPSAVTISDSESHMDQLIKEISRKKIEISQSQDEPERIKPRRTSNKIIQTSNQSQTLRTVSKRLARRPRATVEGAQPQLEDQISEDDDTSSLSSLLREFEKRRTIKTPVKKRDDGGGMDVGIPWRAPSGVELDEVNGELFFDSEEEEDESTFRPKQPKGKRVFVNKRKLTMNRKSTSKRTDDLAVNEGSTTRSRRRGAVGNKENRKMEEEKDKNKEVSSVFITNQQKSGGVLESIPTEGNIFENHTEENWDDDHALENRKHKKQDKRTEEIKGKKKKVDSVATSVNKKKLPKHEEQRRKKRESDDSVENFEVDFKRFMVEKFRQEREKKKKVDCTETASSVNKKKLPQNQEQRTKGREGSSNRDDLDSLTLEDDVFEDEETLESRKTDKKKKAHEEHKEYKKTEEDKIKNKKVDSVAQRTKGREGNNKGDVLDSTTTKDNVFESYTVQNNMQDDEEDEESLETRKLKNRKADKKKKAHEENKDYKKTEEKNIKNKKVDSVATCTAQRTNRDVFDNITTEDNVFENYTVENNDEEDESLENRKLERNTQKTDKRKKPFEEKRDVNRKTEEKKCKNKRVNSCTGTKNEGQRTEGRDTSNNRDVLETIEVTAGTSKNVVKEVSQATTNMSSNRRETTSTKRRTKKRSTSYYGDKFEVTTTQPSTVEESGVRRSGRQRRQAPVVAAGVIYCTKPTSIVPITRTLSKNIKRPQNTMSPIEEEPPVSKKRPAKTQSVVRGQSTDEEDNETDALEEAIPTATNYIATSTEDESMSPRMPRKNRSVLSGRISKPSNPRVVNKKLTKSVQRTISGGFDGEFSKTLSISDKTITWMFDASGYMSLAGSPGVSYKSYDHMRMGVLKISAGKEKPPQITRQHDLYFVVAEGECIAGVMDKSHIVRKQDSFLVPRGAEYYVKNQSKTQHLILIFSRFIPNNTV